MKKFYISVTHLILRLAIVQNKFQQANKTKIDHINDNCIKFEVSLHFLGIWPTVCRPWGHPQILADQSTLSQPGGTDYPHLITTGIHRFSDLLMALHCTGMCVFSLQ